jgi:hypothetical protein
MNFIDLHARLNETLFGVSGEEQVIIGRAGFLFFSETLPAYTNRDMLSDEQLNELADSIARLSEALASRSVGFMLIVAPNKNAIYPEYMPYNYRPAVESSLARGLLDALAARNINAPDTLSLLSGHKTDGWLYYHMDTHWNARGALLVYRAIMEKLLEGREPFDYETYENAEWRSIETRGDLTNLYRPLSGDAEMSDAPDITREYRSAGVIKTLMDPRIETISPRNDLSIYVLRDSFGEALFPYLANNTGRLVYSRAVPNGADWIDGIEYVVIEIAQRNLPSIGQSVASMMNSLSLSE